MFESLSDGPADRMGQSTKTIRIVLSVAVHIAILVALVHTGRMVGVRAFIPGTKTGTRIELTYLPGGSSGALPAATKRLMPSPIQPRIAPVATPDPQLAKLALLPPVPQPIAASQPVKEAQQPSSGSSGEAANDALGTDNIQIALTTYSPSPKPDLSSLPHGTQGDVVVDITIDPTGKVADLQILHALGYGVEGKVADIVRTWTFHPATKDGIPVASVQELHFHFGPV